MQIICAKLISGESIIARLDDTIWYEDGKTVYKLDKPVMMGLMQDQQGRVGIGFGEWVIGHMEDGVLLDSSKLMFPMWEAPSALEQQYIEATSSIQLA